MDVTKKLFGVLSDGTDVHIYTVSNKNMQFSVIDYGCMTTSIILPSKTGMKNDILLGYSTLAGFTCTKVGYFGALVGRYANRIKDARFTLNGKTYTLDKNEGPNYVHGGDDSYHTRVWDSEIVESAGGKGIKFAGVSKDGDQGFPGNLSLEIFYLLNDNNEIIQIFRGTTDKETPVNITNHAFYNLRGAGKGTILEHTFFFDADGYLETDSALLPTGKILSVTENPAYDFRKPKPVSRDIAKTDNGIKGVYDVCFVLNKKVGEIKRAVEIFDKDTNRRLVVSTNQNSVQFYSGKRLEGIEGKTGLIYLDSGGFVLETQNYPDAPNHNNFPNCILHPGELYEHKTIYAYSW